eukprot:PITA_10158
MDNNTYNRISTIKNEDGEFQNTHKDIEVVFVQHFRNITQENNLDRDQSIRGITRRIPKLVTRQENFNLNRSVTGEEVSEVLKDMQNGKAPGLDGFNVDFFNSCWHIVKEDILNVVEDSRGRKTTVKALNTSFIFLIPKQDSAQTIDKYKPIALCYVVYKIISKQKASGMIIQLDIAKAYDKVNSIYIKKVLTTFGFDHKWVRWVMALVTSSNFSILVNGIPSKIFSPSRGLGQGDLLSPFLFILMMEGLGRSIKHAKAMGKIKGLQLSENGLALTHQQFVDDNLLQGIPTVKEATTYNQILKDFSMATGMEVNLSKSKIFVLNTNIVI